MTIMQTLAASGSVINYNYTGATSPVYTYGAIIGFSVDNYNGAIKVTVGYWYGSGYSSTAWQQLSNYSGTAATTSYSEIVQMPLSAATANTILYGTAASGYVKHPCNCIFGNPIYYYGNDVDVNGNSPGPGGGWIIATKWDGGRYLTIYLNPSRNGTGDTGTTISMNNLDSAMNNLSGGLSTTQVTLLLPPF